MGFQTPVYNYTPVISKYNFTNREKPAVDSIHLSHFPMGSGIIDETKWFDEIQRLRSLNERLRSEKEASIVFERDGASWWCLITLFATLSSATIGLIIHNLYISRRTSKRHKRVEKDINELKLYDRPMNLIPGKQNESKIEVAGDQQITINMERGSPALPDGHRKNSL